MSMQLHAKIWKISPVDFLSNLKKNIYFSKNLAPSLFELKKSSCKSSEYIYKSGKEKLKTNSHTEKRINGHFLGLIKQTGRLNGLQFLVFTSYISLPTLGLP